MLSWDVVFSLTSVDDKVEYFTQTVQYLFDKYVPIRTRQIKLKRCPWFTLEIHKLIAERELLHKQFKKYKTHELRSRYKYVRNIVNARVREAKRKFFATKFDTSLPSKKLWHNLKRSGVFGKDIAMCSYDPNTMNDYFTSFQSSVIDNVPASGNTQEAHNFNGFAFHCVDVFDTISAWNAIGSDAAGCDDISPKFLKLILPAVVNVLVHIFNAALTASQFPSLWKSAIVIPLPKKGSPMDLCDYRPISLLCFLGKVLEKIMSNQIVDYLENRKLLSVWQSGFRPKHSCETTLVRLSSDILQSLDRDEFVALVLLDFSKAFDCVNHGKLLHKLKELFGFSSSAISLIASFLSNRSQCVRVQNDISHPLPLTSGVPQGSVLGPLLFCLFIDDLPSMVQDVRILMYADDVQLYLSRPIGLVEDCIVRMNDDLARICEWSQCNLLSLNASKSTCLPIYRVSIDTSSLPPVFLNNTILPYTHKARNLGIMINNKFTCCDYVSSVIAKVYGGLRQLWLSANILPRDTRLKLVRSLILPHFAFGSLVFAKLDSACMRKLAVAFNDTVRFVHKLSRYSHISPYINSVVGCSLNTYLIRKGLTFLFKLLHEKCPSYLYNDIKFLHSSRHCRLLIPRFFSQYGERAYFVQFIREWNCLPDYAHRASSLGVFSKLLKSIVP